MRIVSRKKQNKWIMNEPVQVWIEEIDGSRNKLGDLDSFPYGILMNAGIEGLKTFPMSPFKAIIFERNDNNESVSE